MDAKSNMIERPEGYRLFHAVAMAYVASLLIANTIAVKIVTVLGLTLPAGIIVFPLAYIFGDTLTEVYGYAKARAVIWWGFFCLAGMVAIYWLAIVLPPADFWTGQQSFEEVFALVPRLAVSSFIAYLVGEFLNAAVLSRLKVRMKGRHFWFRALGSTLVGQGADSVVFNFTAFTGVFPLSTVAFIALSGWILKSLYEVVALPATYFIVARLKRIESVDVYDVDVNYSPFTLK